MRIHVPRVRQIQTNINALLAIPYARWCLLSALLSVALVLNGCGAAFAPSATPSQTALAVSPTSAKVVAGSTQQYTANLKGGAGTTVRWLVENIEGGNPQIGTISSTGLYTAPASPPANAVKMISAISAADLSKSASVPVEIIPQFGISVSVSPGVASVQTGQKQQFTAAVTGTSNTAVRWLVNNIRGGNSSVGTISASGLFTAPVVPPANLTETIRAISVAEASKYASAAVMVTAPSSAVSISVAPATATVQAGLTQRFTAAVSGTHDTSVTWLVNNIQGGSSSVGTISSTGVFTAPATPSANQFETITAVSSADPSKSARATVKVTSASSTIAITVTPGAVNVQAGLTAQFTATVTGTSNTAVVWSVNGIQGGNSSVGRISPTGLFTAPSAVPATPTESITATSYQQPANSATARVVVASPPPSTGEDFYVAPTGSDSNDGSSARPWKTIQHAADLVQPGWNVHVAPGTYLEDIFFKTSGTSTNRIRFVSDQRGQAHIVGQGADKVWQTGDNSTNHGGDYVDIVGFDISGSNSRIGIAHYGINGKILNNIVHDIPASVCNSSGGAGIFIGWNGVVNGGANGNLIDGNYIHDIGGWPNPCASNVTRVQGIYVGTRNNTLSNNIVFHSASYGIQIYGDTTAETVVNNTVFDNNYGIILGTSSPAGGTVLDNCQTNNNISVNNTYYGIREEDFNGGASIGTHNAYINNLVFGNGTDVHLVKSTATGTVSTGTTATVFLDYTGDSSGDYHLKLESPAIDAGTSIAAPAKDFDGGSRLQGSSWDIGAYEFGASPAIWPWE